jgi:hypothetical protein
MKKIVLTAAAISVASTTYQSTASAQLQGLAPMQIYLYGSVGCPQPTPLPSIPPPPPKVFPGQDIEVLYRTRVCDPAAAVPIQLTFDLIRQSPAETIANVLPAIQINNPGPTPPSLPLEGSAGSLTLRGSGFQSICMRVQFVQNPPPITLGATFGDCVSYEIVALPAPVPVNPWIPTVLSLIVFGVTLRWSSKRSYQS